MNLNGFDGLLNLLNLLDENQIDFDLDRQRDDAIMVTFAFVGARVEVEIFSDHIEYSIFHGSEDVLNDQSSLVKMIKDESSE
jgi:hypothetical protein